MATVDPVLLVLAMSNVRPRAWSGPAAAFIMLALVGCGSGSGDQAQLVSVTPTPIPTTAPLVVPTVTPVPTPTATPLPLPTATPIPTPLPTPLPAATDAPVVEATSSPDPAAQPTATTEAATVLPQATEVAEPVEVTETPTPIPTLAAAAETGQGSSGSELVPDPDAGAGTALIPVDETPTAAPVTSTEPSLECYDTEVKIYRGFVDGVDSLSLEGGRVYCTGAGTNGVSAARSYRHSSGLVIQRNGNYIRNDADTAYIPYSGLMHFCLNGQPGSAPVRADTVPALLRVIDNDARNQVAQGATGPASFTASGAQC